jgi:hypothetical protein
MRHPQTHLNAISGRAAEFVVFDEISEIRDMTDDNAFQHSKRLLELAVAFRDCPAEDVNIYASVRVDDQGKREEIIVGENYKPVEMRIGSDGRPYFVLRGTDPEITQPRQVYLTTDELTDVFPETFKRMTGTVSTYSNISYKGRAPIKRQAIYLNAELDTIARAIGSRLPIIHQLNSILERGLTEDEARQVFIEQKTRAEHYQLADEDDVGSF